MNNSVSGKEVRCTSAAQMVKWTNAFKNEGCHAMTVGERIVVVLRILLQKGYRSVRVI